MARATTANKIAAALALAAAKPTAAQFLARLGGLPASASFWGFSRVSEGPFDTVTKSWESHDNGRSHTEKNERVHEVWHEGPHGTMHQHVEGTHMEEYQQGNRVEQVSQTINCINGNCEQGTATVSGMMQQPPSPLDALLGELVAPPGAFEPPPPPQLDALLGELMASQSGGFAPPPPPQLEALLEELMAPQGAFPQPPRSPDRDVQQLEAQMMRDMMFPPGMVIAAPPTPPPPMMMVVAAPMPPPALRGTLLRLAPMYNMAPPPTASPEPLMVVADAVKDPLVMKAFGGVWLVSMMVAMLAARATRVAKRDSRTLTGLREPLEATAEQSRIVCGEAAAATKHYEAALAARGFLATVHTAVEEKAVARYVHTLYTRVAEAEEKAIGKYVISVYDRAA